MDLRGHSNAKQFSGVLSGHDCTLRDRAKDQERIRRQILLLELEGLRQLFANTGSN